MLLKISLLGSFLRLEKEIGLKVSGKDRNEVEVLRINLNKPHFKQIGFFLFSPPNL